MKKLVLTLLCLVFITPLFAEREVISEFGGMVDKISEDKLKSKFATDMENVLTDDYSGSIVKNQGYNKFSSTSIYNGQSPKKIYRYKQVDGDEYMIAQTSGTIKYTLGSSAFTTLLTTMNPSYLFDFTTAFDELIATDGSDDPWGFNGTSVTHYTVLNATNPKKARFVEFWNNRTFWGGIDSYLSTVYYSETGYAWNIGANNYININVSDGDKITGFKVSNGRFYVFKTRSMWELVEDSPGNFRVVPISSEIGCLYQNSISHWLGFPVWMSHRGIELYNGTFNLISNSKDHFFRGLSQLESGEYSWNNNASGDWANGTYGSVMEVDDPLEQEPQETAADWSSGTLVQCDTTTYTNSIIIDKPNTTVTNIALDATATASSYASWSPGYPPSNINDDSLTTYWRPDLGESSGWVMLDLGSVVDVKTSVFRVATSAEPLTVYLMGSTNNSDWDTLVTKVNPESGVYLDYTESLTGSYRYYRFTTNTGTDLTVNELKLYSDYYSSASITSQSLDYGFEPSTHGYLVSSVTIPSGTDLTFQVRTSTDDTNWDTWTTVANGAIITNDPDRYVQWKATFTASSDLTKSPQIHQVYIGGSWLSEKKDLSAVPSSFGSFSAIENNVDSDATITYYTRTATGTDALDDASWTAQSKNTPITSTAKQWIQLKAEFNMTSTTTVLSPPTLNGFSIVYYLSDTIDVIGINYKDRYWVSVSTRTDTDRNDVTMVYDTNGEWTRFSFGMSAATMYRNRLYTGEPTSSGLIFQQDIEDLYTYNGTAYESYWQSKLFDFGDPTYEKTYSPIWAIAKGESSGALSLDWRLDGITTWSTGALNLNNSWDGVSVTKIPQPFYKGRYIQYRISDDSMTTGWEFRKLIQDYKLEPLR